MDITSDENFQVIAERHPHISNKIEMLWGHVELRHYLNSLFMDARGGTRQGFEPHIAKSLFAIMCKLDDHINYVQPSDIWSSIY